MPGHGPEVSVVVPTYRREGTLRAALAGLLAQDHASYEIIVVDQTPEHDADTAAFLAAHGARLRWHRLGRPGLARARQAGVRLARGEIVLFMDDDAVPLDRRLVAAHAAAYASPLVGAVAGRILEPIAPNAPPGVARVDACGRVRSNFRDPVSCDLATAKGANMSFRRRALEEVGPFDPRFAGTSVLEETDCCYRLRALGYVVRFEPAAAVRHLHAPTGGCREHAGPDPDYWLFRNSALFYLKHAPRAGLPLFVAASAARAAVRVARAGRGPRAWARLMRGLADGLRAHRGAPPADEPFTHGGREEPATGAADARASAAADLRSAGGVRAPAPPR